MIRRTILVVFLAVVLTLSAAAHSGRTDSSGGHRDNKNTSGLGAYHYHHGYEAHLHENGICPYESADASTGAVSSSSSAAPAAPTTNKTNQEKADFLDQQIAIFVQGSSVYHTIDCQVYQRASDFTAMDIASAQAQGSLPCSLCRGDTK